MHIPPIKKCFHTNAFLLICALLYASITCAFSLTRLYTFKDSLIDIGAFDQVLWNLVHHHGPLSTVIEPFDIQNWFGRHFSPILLLLVPFYAWWPHLELLQIVQSLCFAFTGIILFHALKAAGARTWEAWVGAALYWCNPFVLSAAIWDFHEIAFAAPLIAIALWALCAKRFNAMILALALLLLTKEHYGLSVAGFGMLWGLRYRQWRRAGVVMAFGIIVFLLLFIVVMPALHGGMHPMLGQNGNDGRYGWLAAAAETRTHVLMDLLFSADHNIPGFMYVFLLLLSGLMLPLLAPFYLAPALADIAANLLSANPMPRHIAAYHSAAVIPIVIVSAYQGYGTLIRKWRFLDNYLKYMLIPIACFLPGSGLTLYDFSYWELDRVALLRDHASVDAIRALVPDQVISAQPNIGMFFADREEIYPFPHQLELSAAVIVHIHQPFHNVQQTHMGIPYGESNAAFAGDLHNLMQMPGWHVAYWHAPWLLMMRGAAHTDETAVRADIARHIDAFSALQQTGVTMRRE